MDLAGKTSQDPGILLRLAYYHSQKGGGRKAIKTLRRLQKSSPKNPDFMYYLALGYEDFHRPRHAIVWFKRLTAADPKRADAYFHLAVNLDAVKKFNRSEPYLLKTLELNPAHAVALNYLGYSWVDRDKNLPQALVYIQRALSLDPENDAFLDSLGWACFKLGRLSEAETALARAVQRAQDPLVWEHYGDIL